MTKSAYRFRLTRGAGDRVVLWCMVNPSIAEDQEPGAADVNDPTITKVQGFMARYFAGDRTYVGNKFARRATDVRELRGLTMAEAVGPENDQQLAGMMAAATTLIYAWGPLAKLPPHLRERWRQVHAYAVALGHTPLCLGVAQDGYPRHPLMVPYATAPRPWTPPA